MGSQDMGRTMYAAMSMAPNLVRPNIWLWFKMIDTHDDDSGQIIIFHQPRFSLKFWGISLTKPPFASNLTPDWYQKNTVQKYGDPLLWPKYFHHNVGSQPFKIAVY